MKYCYFNGKIVPEGKICLKLNDIGILRGYGVFDFLRTYHGKPFLLREHLVRFKRSAKLLNLTIPLSQKQLAHVIQKLLLKNKVKESEIRLALTGGPTSDAITYSSPSFFILVEKIQKIPDIAYQKGVKLITCEYQREVPQAKTINYITAIRTQPQKNKQGAFEILYIFNNKVLECTTSNFFIFKNNTLITPKDNILIGTTRNLILKLSQNKFRIQERNLKVQELGSADEAFITATNKEIVPVVKIDNITIGNGTVGDNTKCLINLFREYVDRF